METFRDIIVLGRFHFLLGGLFLYSFGGVVAGAFQGELDSQRLILGYLVLGPAHLAVNYSNDHFDRISDANGEPTPFSGGSGVLQRRPELAPLALHLAIALSLSSLVSSIPFSLAYGYGPGLFLWVLLGNLVGWAYTTPPFSMAYRGIGESSTAVTTGILVPGMGWFVVTGGIDASFMALSIPILLVGLAFILTVQVPDVESDLISGKSTLLSRVGRRKGFTIIAISLVLSVACLLVVTVLVSGLSFLLPVTLIAILPVIPALRAVLSRVEGRDEGLRHVNAIIGSFFIYVITATVYVVIISGTLK